MALSHKKPAVARLIGRFGTKPNFLIIGTQKGGTTSLYGYLAAHPKVFSALVKEVHYFDFHFDCGLNWYLAHFPPKVLTRSRGALTGEASPEYLFTPQTPARVAELLPDARLIVMLRNPIDRAYSQYQMSVRRGRETLPFEQAVQLEAERLADERAQLGEEVAYAHGGAHRHHSYLLRGHYAEQLERWFEHFPRESFYFIESESFFWQPAPAHAAALDFLKLPEHRLPSYPNFNHWGYAKIAPDLREQLERYFTPHNERLEGLVERRFWREPLTAP